MKHSGLTRAVLALWMTCLPMAAWALGFSSTTTQVDKTHLVKHMADCGPFKLKDVNDDAAAQSRTYWFDGICRIWTVHIQGGVPQGKTGEATLWAEARVTWQAGTSRLEELVKLTDPAHKHSGTLRSGFKCMGDAVVENAQCVQLEFKNLTDWTGFAVPSDANRPLTAGSATLAAANKLAAMKTPAPAPQRQAQPAQAPVVPQVNLGAPATGGMATPAPRASRLAALPAVVAALPDLTGGAQIVVAGKFGVAPGATLALKDTDARAASGGVCQIAFEHEMRNLGQAGSPATDRRWTIEGNPAALVAQTPPIAAGAALSRVDTLGLRPGTNKLRLRLDPNQQVMEASESNNELTLTVNLAGLCGGAPLAMPQTAPTDNLRFSPAKEAAAPVRR